MGPRRAPHPWSQRVGDSPGSPAGFLGLSGWGIHPLFLSSSSHLPLLISPASPSMSPRTHVAWRGIWRAGDWPGSSAASPARVGQVMPSTPLPLFPESPSCLPLLIFPASGVLSLSGLHFSSPLSPPMSYWFTLVFLLSSWASESPTSGPQAL